MLFGRISSFLHSSRTLSSKNNVPKCQFYGTADLFSEKDGLPKRPVPAYLRFLYSVLPELSAKFPDRSFRENTTMVKKLWESLDQCKKRELTKSYYDELDEYRMARLRYECSIHDGLETEEKQSTIVTKKDKRKLKKLRKVSGRPKKPPTAFLLFLHSKRGTLPKKPAVNWVSEVTLEYKNLKEDEKVKFQEEAKRLNDEYKKSITEWEDKLIKEGQIDIMYKRSKFSKIPD
ncbi:transcription factor A, mitochondrial-like isoform X2 [Planococcus citri]|uniref:transcription factor A, mitochondrial-like isoform X2 n=1 Tax=Planococcus citri TaxID=170843 RepID=UPI0031F9CB8A